MLRGSGHLALATALASGTSLLTISGFVSPDLRVLLRDVREIYSITPAWPVGAFR